MTSGGRLRVGEVGEATPNARTIPIGSGHVVEVHSGLLEFFYLVIQTLCGVQTEFGADGSVAAPAALTHGELARRVAAIFRKWEAGVFSQKAAYAPPFFPVDRPQGIPEQLTLIAAMFVVAHELGHVIHDVDGPARLMPPEAAASEEVYADWFAVMNVIRLGRPFQPRMLYAGIIVAVRIFALLERLGCPFPRSHPAPRQRVQYCKQFVRQAVDGELSFTVLSTIALAYDEMLEGVENVLLGKGLSTLQTAERVGVRLWAMVEARAKGQLDHDRFLRDIEASFDGVDEETARTVAASFRSWFLVPSSTGLAHPAGQHKSAMTEALRSMVTVLPEPAKTAFARAFAS